MSNEIIVASLNKDFESIKKINEDGVEYWEARELMPLLGYRNWREFENAIVKAKTSCEKSGQDSKNHFGEVPKMVRLGSGSEREIRDYNLSRYACYLIAQNGDPRKLLKYIGLPRLKIEIYLLCPF